MGQLRRINGKDGAFWGCSNYKDEPPRKASYPDANGVPNPAPKRKKSCSGFGMGSWI
ncbi:hypothetical protein [Burkholderia sp. Ac-20353]|uniref:hypothetical protein n=1 Tax=Burkholderia sp. Ac-20353 TaxID=2703894 RepID=UPI00197B121E|nr:hypothetical protein [Burkholderia sp. Ac-20353]